MISENFGTRLLSWNAKSRC